MNVISLFAKTVNGAGPAIATGLMLLVAGCTPGNQKPAAMGNMTGMDHEQHACHFKPIDSVNCGRTPTTAFDGTGRLWAAYVVGEHIYVAASDDRGNRFGAPVKVNAAPEEVYTNGENRPKIAFGPGSQVYVSWTKVMEGPFAGDIRFARSLDGGRTFEPVRTINDDGIVTSHRFETMMVDSSGDIFIAWLDKRDMVAAEAAGRSYTGAAIYYTVSTDDGATFAKNRKVADYSCECCRIAMSETGSGDAAVFWRHIYNDTTRDHGFAELGVNGVVTPAQRATVDNWQIDACPHHGPAMVTAGDSGYHVSWFTLGDARKGIFYGHYNPGTGQMDKLLPVAGAGSGHSYLARIDNGLFLVWKQFDGEKTGIKLRTSADEGASWRPASVIADTVGASDHPLLVTHDGAVYLSWHTADEGLRIIPLNPAGSIQ